MSAAKIPWEQILTVFLSRGADDLDGNTIAAWRLGVRRTSGRAGRSRRLARQLMRLRARRRAGERDEAFVTARDSLAIGAKLRQEISEVSDPVGAEKRLSCAAGDVDIECAVGWP
ncbi:hypothetical protein LB523_17305 [Mesorhizobium sp. ESP-6-4]|uniref:hypothetical protein n=1 Tax=Mesorhizobium sp. ESP-6-4 TaxID=2876624 RepID=UPI001CCBBDB0|nr:hypothetical protein [Mesorhizobium sp. ESP-6-4]MBZ9660811.1 hypothetical protein [Mesorhizobium sp. ESP-6-4]